MEGGPLNQESRTLSFMGMRVHFLLMRPEVPVKNRMLLLSSPLMNSFHWRKLLPELDGLGCLAALVDLPGFGLSESDMPQDEGLTASMVWGVLDDIDQSLGAPMSMWHLAGHGCASRVILRMAAQYPDSVKSQVHLSPMLSVPGGRKAPEPLAWYDANIRSPERFRAMVEHYAAFPMDDYIVDRMRRPLLRPGVREAMDSYLRRAATAPGLGAGFCPTMVIYGGRDPLLDETRTRQMHDLLQGAEYHRLANAGHFPTETHSRAIRDYLRGWLRFND